MRLGALIDGLAGARVIGDAGVEVRRVTADSREVATGDVFVAVKGLRADGHAHVAAAIANGAAAVVVERDMQVAVPQVVVGSGAVALGWMVGKSLGDPAAAMTLVGVTGTNGKTTTTYLVEAILAAAGHRPGVIGTVSYRWGGATYDAPYTTPTPHVLHETLAKMRDAGCTHVVMEVSSAALVMDRLAGVWFAVGAFSNLTQDHLDVHGTMEAYRDAKRRLFADHLTATGTAVVNVDDPFAEDMARGVANTLRVTCDSASHADIRAASYDSTVKGIHATFATPRGELAVAAKPLIGHYNVANLALAIGICEALGVPHDAIARGIATLPGVPGRVERVVAAADADLDVFVDYAHTPDALRNVLAALRPLTKRRLICVFGCGGDRDPTKRPKMAAAVAELADLGVVTSDNPRTEDPRAIIEQILPGIPKPFAVDVDRRAAIRAAISEATPGDVVVIAGKGHEDYQIVGTTKHHFDDREEAAAALTYRWRRSLGALAGDCDGEIGPRTSDVAPRPEDVAISRVTIDSRTAAPGALYVAIRGDNHDGHDFITGAISNGAVAVVTDRPVAEVRGPTSEAPPVPSIVVGDTRVAIGKLARVHRDAWGGRLVAITGSAGKTTTKELARAALSAAATTHAADGSLNNETGVPLTLLGLRAFHRYAVVEMGMRGLGQIEYLTRLATPDVAVVVNAGTAHIELLGSTDAIARAKSEIWLGLRAGGTVVRPADDERLAAHAREHAPTARVVTFGDIDAADVRLASYRARDDGGDLELDVFGERRALQLQLVGRHAAIDACAALAAAHAAGASIDDGLAGLARARAPAMRGELVTVAGRRVIVDCYNANPASMAAALRTLAERSGGARVAVLGDMLELGDHAPAEHAAIGALATQLGIRAFALGDHAAALGEPARDPADAAARALAATQPGDWILLKASRGMRLERVLDALKASA
jgi:murE/murF fusion protein|nr:UDP-N-acetylmuramoyl-L-alanyl-D-glutamate--2,6-diaminopimelate ligase [Kofleriaceae bacterium]